MSGVGKCLDARLHVHPVSTLIAWTKILGGKETYGMGRGHHMLPITSLHLR